LEELWAVSGRSGAFAAPQRLASISLSRAALAASSRGRVTSAELNERVNGTGLVSSCDDTDLSADMPLVKASLSYTQGPTRQRMLSMLSNFESPWYVDCPDSVPSMEVPDNIEPLCVHELRDATLESIAELLGADEWPFPSFLSQFHGASEFEPCRWASSSRVEGTAVRVLNFTMPLPQDLPRAVAILINLPESTRITNTYRLRKSADEITLIVQVNTPGVPFGENFRIQELSSFRRLPGGGIELRKWVEVIWIVALPWGCGPIKTFAEKKIVDDYLKGAGPLASFLNEAAAKKLEESVGARPESLCSCPGSTVTVSV